MMKKTIGLLLAINLGLLAYFSLDKLFAPPAPVKHAEISPEKMRILSQSEIEALPKRVVEPPPPPPPPVTACYEWGVFSAATLMKAQIAISKLSLQATVKHEKPQQIKRFWVYRLPLKTAAEAQAKANELKALGVENLFVVQEAKWRNAISFGIFEDEALANNLLNELKAKGVRNIVKASRNPLEEKSSLLFSKLAEKDTAELKKLRSDFPETALQEVACH